MQIVSTGSSISRAFQVSLCVRYLTESRYFFLGEEMCSSSGSTSIHVDLEFQFSDFEACATKSE
jgi:hypothetical protein